MGITDNVNKVLEWVKNILERVKDLPHDVYYSFRWRLVKLQNSIDALPDPKTMAASIYGMVQKQLDEFKDTIIGALEQQTDHLTAAFNNLYGIVSDKVGEIGGVVSEKFNEVQDMITEHIINPVAGFLKKYLWPIIIITIAIVLAPFLGPFLNLLL